MAVMVSLVLAVDEWGEDDSCRGEAGDARDAEAEAEAEAEEADAAERAAGGEEAEAAGAEVDAEEAEAEAGAEAEEEEEAVARDATTPGGGGGGGCDDMMMGCIQQGQGTRATRARAQKCSFDGMVALQRNAKALRIGRQMQDPPVDADADADRTRDSD
ncbi:hypothetical protein TgHK011_009063 [Trichoderma gracile]|nr:hypothetical protein TgHK011_009063 [Trichoderma gracile]